jgi:hypothetical protein
MDIDTRVYINGDQMPGFEFGNWFIGSGESGTGETYGFTCNAGSLTLLPGSIAAQVDGIPLRFTRVTP